MKGAGVLAGVRVLDLGGMGPGPFATMLLADFGADVLRIGRAGEELPFVENDLMNRGKLNVVLDLKSTAGREQVLDYARSADVVVEGFRPGVVERLGIGPEPCLAANPALVYGRITGWGHGGPLSSAAGHDVNFISLTGALHAIGEAGGPPVVPLALVGDFGGGAMSFALGLVSGLYEASQSGEGQIVEASIVDGAALLTVTVRSLMREGSWVDDRGVNVFDGGAPFYGVYRTADDRYVSVGAYEARFYRRLVRMLGLEESTLPPQLDRNQWPHLRTLFAERFATRSRDEWCALLEGGDACFAPVLSMTEAPLHPHNVARNAFFDVGTAKVPSPTPRFELSGTRRPQPMRTVVAGTSSAAELARVWPTEQNRRTEQKETS